MLLAKPQLCLLSASNKEEGEQRVSGDLRGQINDLGLVCVVVVQELNVEHESSRKHLGAGLPF